MVLLGNVDCVFALFIVAGYSFFCYAIYWFLSQLAYACDGPSGNVITTYTACVVYFTMLSIYADEWRV
jgi:hypothetical protein